MVAAVEPYAEHQAAIEQLVRDANRIKMIIVDPPIEAWAKEPSVRRTRTR